MQQNSDEKFPRTLTEKEKEWLFTALPENKIGYKKYRDLIDSFSVIGYGRFGKGNLVLGDQNDTVDLEDSSSPIFAISNVAFEEANIYVTIHEEFDNQVEVDIKSMLGEKIPNNLHQTKIWTYSTWLPGQKAPSDNSDVREIHLIRDELVLAILPTHKKIWIYNSKSGINHFIPVTNYYNELMHLLENRDPETALNPGRLFANANDFTDEQLAQAFLVYNKHWNRVELDYHLFEKKDDQKKKSIFGFKKN